MIAGRLEIELAANVARLSSDMQQARSVVGNAMQGIDRAVAQTKAALAGLGISLGVGAFTALIKGAIDAVDHLNDLSKSTGIAVEDLAGLRIAAKQSGTELEGVASAINKLSQNMGANGEKFKALGVTAKEPLEAFKQLADRFAAIQDPQLRAALGAEALGKSWATAAPLLAEGGAKIGQMVERGKALSGVTKEMAEEADALNDKLTLLTGSTGTLNRMVAPLLPLLNRLADDLLKAKESSAALGESNFSPLLEAAKAIVVLFGNVGFVLKGVGTEIGGIAAQLTALATGDVKGFKAIRAAMIEDAQRARTAFDKWEQSIMAVGTASKSTAKDLDTMDQVTRRMISDAEAQARAFLEAEKRKKDAEAAAKKAAEDAQRARVAFAEADLKAAEMFAQDYAEAWKFADEARTKEARDEMKIRMDLMDAENKAAEMFADDYAEAWKYAYDFQKNEDKKVADQFKQDWGGFFDGIEGAFRDAWDSFASHGKSAAEVLKQALKRTLFDWLYQQMVKPIVLNILGNFMGGGAGGVGGVGGAGGGVGGVVSAGSSLVNAVSGAGSLWAAGSQFISGMSLPSAAVGSAAIEAGVGVATTSAAGLGSTFASAMMAIPVWGWIIAGLATIAAILSRKGGGPKDEGQFTGSFDASGRLIGSAAAGFNIVGTSANSAVQQFTTGLAEQIAATTRSFGVSNAFQLGAGIVRDPRGTAPTFIDTLLRDASGRELFRQHNDQVGRSDEEMQTELELQAQRVILAALQASALPQDVADILNSLVASSATSDEIKKVVAAALEMKQVIDALAKLGVPGLDIKALKLMQREGEKLSDTFNSVAQGLSSFYDLFYTEEERRSMLQAQLTEQFAALGETLPTTREGFRQLVESLDLTDESQASLYRSLLELAPAFADLVPIVESVDAAIEQVNEVIEFSARQLLPIDYWQTIEGMAEKLVADFTTKYGGVIGGQPTKMGSLSLQSTLLSETVAQYQAQIDAMRTQSLATGSPLPADYYALEIAVEKLRKELTQTGVDIAQLTILEAQYGQEKAEQLLELQKWYDAQKTLIGTNATALEALEELFQTKWQEILDGVASASALDDARARLRDWWSGLFLNEKLSPLTLQERFAEAKRQYESTLALAQGGDVNAIAGLSGISTTVLELARQLMASSPAYTALFREIAEQTGTIAGVTEAEINSRLYSALPTSSPIASSADIQRLETRIAELTTALLTEPLTVQSPTLETAIAESSTEPAGALAGVA